MKKIPIVMIIILFILIIICIYDCLFSKSKMYYTKVTNKEVEVSNNKYEYNLLMYDKNGMGKRIAFKSSRLLKENAYLKIKYYSISRVNIWEEIDFSKLPSKVKEKYS